MLITLPRGFLSRLLSALPSQCAICRGWPSQPLCHACVAQSASPHARCRTCALRVEPGAERCDDCAADRPALDACVAACTYAWPWDGLITRFKFQQEPGWSGPFALLMKSAPWAEVEIEQADWILPMPLSDERLRERGYNQAWELARRLARPPRASASLLLRVRDTPAQSGLRRAERLRNLAGALAIEPNRIDEVQGRRVLLVDDVMTSGASLAAAAQVLRRAGASRVSALVLARTEVPAG